MIGEVIKEDSIVSTYQPSENVRDFTNVVKKDYNFGTEILNKSYTEFNNYSVIDRTNIDQRTFQAYVDENDYDPDEAWKWKGTRGLARKKAWAMHSHLTANYIIPAVFPQNPSQDDDKVMAEAMRDILEWITLNSNYRSSYLLTILGILVNPVIYFQIDYREVNQKIREKTERGYKITEILDEVLSGVSFTPLSVDQILITNVYEQDIQKQRSIIQRRWVEYKELEAKYGKHNNWDYLRPGVKIVLDEGNGLFYEIMDDEHPYLVEEVIWKNRRDDTEVCFLNGIYFGNENLEENPIRHRDNRNAPKYNITPFGYHRLNEHFFYFASMMFEIGWDDRLIDAMYRVVMNREFLDLEQPLFISGIDNIDTSVIFPGGITATQNPDAKIQSILPPKNSNPYMALREIENSMEEATLPETKQGVLPEASQKATAVVSAERNANILLSGVMKSLGESIIQVGNLMIDVSLQHLTTAQYDEITGGLKYREFVLENQMINGRKMSKKIRFDAALIGKKMSQKEKDNYTMKLLEEIGYPENKQSVYVLNPHLSSKMKYLTRIEPDEMLPKNKEFDRIIMERLYQLLLNNPTINIEALTRELIYASRPQNVDELMTRQGQDILSNQIQQIMGQAKQSAQMPGIPATAVSGMPMA